MVHDREQPESGQQKQTPSTTTFPFQEAPISLRGPKTVVHAEPPLQGAADDSAVRPGSSLWNRLFPHEGEPSAAPYTDGAAGLVLGHFELEQRIGVGGMGAVFRALDLRLKRVVALKVLSPYYSRDPAAVQRFQNEARAAAQLDHDNIARVYFIGEDKGLQFIAFEFVTGTNVRDLIQLYGRLKPAEAVNYTLQVTAALKHTAQAGVVHRDIKPSNIIITPNGRAKLVDLGLARKQTSESTGELTTAGTTLGTFDYISPEQAKDPRNVDPRSDIYSLGCTLYHMLTGEPPYPEGTVLQKLLDHHGKEPPDPASKSPGIPPELSATVRKMMASDPNQRYPTPEHLNRDLMWIAQSMGLRGVHPDGLIWTSVHPMVPRFWERYVGWVATAAVLLVIVGLLYFFPLGLPRSQTEAPQADGKAEPSTSTPGAGIASNAAGPSEETSAPTETAAESAVATARKTPSLSASGDLNGQVADRNGASAASRPGTNATDVTEPFVKPPIDTGAAGLQDATPAGDLNQPATVFKDGSLPTIIIGRTHGALPSESDKGREPPGTERSSDGSTKSVATTIDGSSVDSSATAPTRQQPETGTEVSDAVAPISIVTTDGTPVRTFSTLKAACAAVENGGVVELSFNGVRREKPIRIDNKSIHIRAAKGYQPVVEFVPADSASAVSKAEMISVVGGSLNLINVQLRVVVEPERGAKQWALLSLKGAERLRLQQVVITVKNAARLPACVLDFLPMPGKSLAEMEMMNTGQSRFQTEVNITDCFIRGEADLLQVEHADPCRFTIEHSVCALDGVLLNLLGDSFADFSDTAAVELWLNHITCLLSGSLLRMDSADDFRVLPTVQVTAENNIFATSSFDSLVAMVGDMDADEFHNLLYWKGRNNFYDRYLRYWTIISARGTSRVEPLGFQQWIREWGPTLEVNPHKDDVAWRNAWWNGAFSDMAVSDASLDLFDQQNAAVSGAPDGTDAGADLTRIPPVAPINAEPAAAKPRPN